MKSTRQIVLFKGKETLAVWIQSRSDCVKAIRLVDQYSNAKSARETIVARVEHLLNKAGSQVTIESWLDENDPIRQPTQDEKLESYYNRY